MTKEQLGGIVRTIATSALSYAAGKGLLPPTMVADLAAALGVIAIAVWSVVAKKKAA